ncbi:hypothetical protein SSP531S_06230 [Streptomyces spongiicola]|uniref:Uncharacterized protein n=1 Tax=Streptomyces spongiicola TaxID=1690221 RepID=A0A388SRP2_9ACTN|nr:hypothetical protein SSP531S_06230 [Streptomyces spongiicola]
MERVAAVRERDTVFDAAGSREYGPIDHVVKNPESEPTSAGGPERDGAATGTAATARPAGPTRPGTHRERVRRQRPRSGRAAGRGQRGTRDPHMATARRTGTGRPGLRCSGDALWVVYQSGGGEPRTAASARVPEVLGGSAEHRLSACRRRT